MMEAKRAMRRGAATAQVLEAEVPYLNARRRRCARVNKRRVVSGPVAEVAPAEAARTAGIEEKCEVHKMMLGGASGAADAAGLCARA
jgi:hypothetical protein